MKLRMQTVSPYINWNMDVDKGAAVSNKAANRSSEAQELSRGCTPRGGGGVL